MPEVVGLRGFLEKANLGSLLAEAEVFCRDCGAVDVSEILEDDEMCEALADHLQLKKLELRRFDTALEAARAGDSLETALSWSQDTVSKSPDHAPQAAVPEASVLGSPDRTPALAPQGGRVAERRTLFSSTSWGNRRQGTGRGQGGSRGGRGRGQGGYYFDAPDAADEVVTNANHYFTAPAAEEPEAPRGNHYFEEPTAARPSATRKMAREPDVAKIECAGHMQGVLAKFQPFFDAIGVVTAGQKAQAAAFLDEQGAISMEDIVECDLAEQFIAALKLKAVPQSKASKFWQEMARSMNQAHQGGGYAKGSEPTRNATVQRVAGKGDSQRGFDGRSGAAGDGRAGTSGGHYFGAAVERGHAEVARVGRAQAYPSDHVDGDDSSAAIAASLARRDLPAASRGVGAYIRGLDGELWGRVVNDQGRMWKLASGRSARKDTEGVKWHWEEPPAAPTMQRGASGLDYSEEPEVPLRRAVSVLETLEEKRRQTEDAVAAKREAARRKRRAQDHQGAPSLDERRVDPEDGTVYTFEEFKRHYGDAYPASELERYWHEDCTPAPQTAPPTGGRASMHSGHGGRSGAERRRDPDDGRVYTYEELRKKYERAFSESEIQEYWHEECQRTN